MDDPKAVESGVTMNQKVRKLLKLCVLAAIGGCGVLIWRGVADSIHAEYCLHASILVTELLEDYVRENDGQWPRSWEDLEAIKLPEGRSGSMFIWPKDVDRVRDYVRVDFAADPDGLAHSTPTEFTAISPIGPCYESYGRHVPFLLEALRETRASADE